MNWKDILGLLQNIYGIGPTFYYGFRHYVLKKDDYEWEKRDDTEKAFFYIITSPIWLIVGIVALFEWIFGSKNKQTKISSEKSKHEHVTQPKNTFILTVTDVFEVAGRGPVITGKVGCGTITSGDSISITGFGRTHKATCIGIERQGRLIQSANVGEDVGLLLSGVKRSDLYAGQIVSRT